MTMRSLLRLLLLGTLACSGASCQLVGAVASRIVPTDTHQAEFKPLPRPTLILVENYKSPSSGYLDAEQVARYLGQELQEHKVAPLVDTGALTRLRDQRNGLRGMSIPAIGQAVGAEQVLYVDLSNVTSQAAGQMDLVRLQLTAQVKLVDVKTGQTLWPVDSSQFPVTVENSAGAGASASEPSLHNDLCHRLAFQIGRLFYDLVDY